MENKYTTLISKCATPGAVRPKATSYPWLSRRLKGDLVLLAVALIWGSAFVTQRLAAQSMDAFVFNGLRFLLGALVLLPFLQKSPGLLHGRDLAGIVLAGFLLFAAAALQQLGLRSTTAGSAGFITGLYVVLVPLFLALGWQQRPRLSIWPAALLAALGLFLLSTGGSFKLNPGDGFELAGACLWAFHVILIGNLVQRLDVRRLAVGQYLVCGLLSLLVGLIWEPAGWRGLESAWWIVLYTGLLSIAFGYTFQAIGQKSAPPSDAAVILSGEAIFAALFGWQFLGERLAVPQWMGAGLILAGILLAQVQNHPKSPFSFFPFRIIAQEEDHYDKN